MYINPFLAGIIATISVEAILTVALAIIFGRNDGGTEGEK